MNELNELAAAVKSLIPGTIGAVSAVVYTRGDWVKRTVNVFMSAAAAYYSYEFLALKTGLPGGLMAFFVGVFAAPAIDKAIEEIGEFEAAQIGMDWLRKFLRIRK